MGQSYEIHGTLTIDDDTVAMRYRDWSGGIEMIQDECAAQSNRLKNATPMESRTV